MLNHWHSAVPECHLLQQFVSVCLEPLAAAASPGDVLLHSWGLPGEPVTYRQYPGTTGIAPSWEALSQVVAADWSVVLRPEGELGVSVTLTDRSGGPREPMADWAWCPTPFNDSPARCGERERATAVFYPGLTGRTVPVELDPLLIGLVPDGTPEGLLRCRALTSVLRKSSPGFRAQLVLDGDWLTDCWNQNENSSPKTHSLRPCRPDLRRCGTVVLLGRSVEFAPMVLQALLEGRQVLAPADAVYVAYLEEGRGELLTAPDDTPEFLQEIVMALEAARYDPAGREAQRRRAQAWSRRWTPDRQAGRLRNLLTLTIERSASGTAQTSRPTRWVLRREVGIGDILFGLSVAWAIRQRDPGCQITYHTGTTHAPWVSWFAHLDTVTSGPFQPLPGDRTVDWETAFPHTALADRSRALGEIAGVLPNEWTPAPYVPPAIQDAAKEWLGNGTRPWIAFVPASRTRSSIRSLPLEVAAETAALLLSLGEVFWLDETQLREPLPQGAVDMTGKLDISTTFALLSLCDLVVSVDSGLLHAGITLRKPVVGLFTHIGALQRLWLAPRFVALQPHLPCSPCGEGEEAYHCVGGVPPEQVPLACVTLLTPGVIAEAAAAALAEPGRVVWNLGPDGQRTVWNVEALPAPCRLAERTPRSNNGKGWRHGPGDQ